MSQVTSRLQQLAAHFVSSDNAGAGGTRGTFDHRYNFHTLSPTLFLQRAAEIEPGAEAIYHLTANGKVLRRSYAEFADRSRGLAYYIKKHHFKRVGILAPNTPAFLESIFGIAAAGAVNVAANHRLVPGDISYIFTHAEAEAIIVDQEYLPLLKEFRKANPRVPFIIDADTDAPEGEFDDVIVEGLEFDGKCGGHGWAGLEAQCEKEEAMIALAYTSGTTSKPKGVVYTHRGAYLAAIGNVIESGLNCQKGRCGFLWILPMFHAMGWTFPWAVTAVRGTHYCLRRVDYPTIWKLLKEGNITHFNAAPTVNTLLCAANEAERLENPVRVTVAASPPTAHLFEKMESLNLLPVHVYGMTETYGPVTRGYHMPAWEKLLPKEKYARMARQGHGFITALPIRVIKTNQAEGALINVERDGKEIGEIVFFGSLCAKEYYKDPEGTRKLFAGGALHSGDLAVWHEDGSVQILDRAKDIIISGGENISSVALESLLIQHPDVLEVGVVSIPDSRWGERPKAFVTVKEGRSLSGKELIEWARHQAMISKLMIPKEVEIMDELPKTSTGKIKKNILRGYDSIGRSP